MPEMIMSFVGKSYAKKGFRFLYTGINPACTSSCSLYSTCQKNMQNNTVYEVVEVLNRTMKCPRELHEEEMILVKIREPLLNIAMENKDIYLGSVTNFTSLECDHDDCKYINYCDPAHELIKNGDRIIIADNIKKIKDCPRNLALSIVKVKKKKT